MFVANMLLSGAPRQRVRDLFRQKFDFWECPACRANDELETRTPFTESACSRCGFQIAEDVVRSPSSDTAIDVYIREYEEAVRAEFKANVRHAAAEQVARIDNDLLRMRSAQKPPWSSITAAEKLRAEITGTLVPRKLTVQVETDFGSAMLAAIGGMSPEDRRRAIDEQREIMRLAGRDSIEVDGETLDALSSGP